MAPDEGEDFGRDFAEESLPPDVESDAVPLRLTKLFPWHRPRKQKVRQDQWVGLTKTLVEKLKSQNLLTVRHVILADGTTVQQAPEIRYLTLPGLDYLDVRLLGEMCRIKGYRLTSIGFLTDTKDAKLMARARVRETGLIQAGYITDTSITFPRNIESICERDGGTLKELKRHAPFHVVNIDACGSIAPVRATHSGRLIDAIYKLVELQLSRANHRWLLFLTVDVRRDDIDSTTLESVCDVIRQNARLNEEFDKAATVFLAEGAGGINEAIDIAKITDGRPLLDLFSLGLSKWLLHLAQEKQWSLKLKKSHCYSTRSADSRDPSMCSLAFEFIPPPVGLPDPFRVTRQQPSPGQAPADPSMQILSATIEIDDLDQILDSDSALLSALNSVTHSLLSEVGYDASALAPLLETLSAEAPRPPHRYPDLVSSQQES